MKTYDILMNSQNNQLVGLVRPNDFGDLNGVSDNVPLAGDYDMSTLYDILVRDKQDILAIAQRYHAANVRLFGSVARREEQEDSDIDLLVDFLPGSTLLDQVALIHELSNRLDRKVDVVSARALNKHMRQRVLNEAIPL